MMMIIIIRVMIKKKQKQDKYKVMMIVIKKIKEIAILVISRAMALSCHPEQPGTTLIILDSFRLLLQRHRRLSPQLPCLLSPVTYFVRSLNPHVQFLSDPFFYSMYSPKEYKKQPQYIFLYPVSGYLINSLLFWRKSNLSSFCNIFHTLRNFNLE